MDITYAPSIGILRLAERAASRQAGPALVAAHGGTLRWADPEVTALGRVYGVDATIGGGRTDVIEALQRGRVVHVASHGQWWREDHFASVLDVRNGGPIDRYISAAEIHRDLDLEGVELVVLSACDTGRAPTDRRGIEGYTGLDAAFMVGGAKAVVSTLWRVRDLAAMLFSVEMHTRLVDGENLAAAFRCGVEAVRSAGTTLAARAIDALDHAADGWRDQRDLQRGVLVNLGTWATFKLSGAHWAARPLDDDQTSE